MARISPFATASTIKFFIRCSESLFFPNDDASVVLQIAALRRMGKESLEERVSALEAQMGGKTLEEHFREQAELIDRLFVYRFDEFERKWDTKLDEKLETKLEEKLETKLEAKLETKLEAKLETKLAPIRSELAAMREALEILLTRLT